MAKSTTLELVEDVKAYIVRAREYIYKLAKANPDKDASSFVYIIRETACTVYVKKHKVVDKRKIIKVFKRAAKETGAVVKISGKRIRVIV